METNNFVLVSGIVAQEGTTKDYSGGKIGTARIAIDSIRGGVKSTEFIGLAGWDENVGEVASLKKGDRITIEGKMKTRTYTNKQGEEKTDTEVNVWSVVRLPRKQKAAKSAAKLADSEALF